MSKHERKFKLVRDRYQELIPPDEWVRLKVGGRRHVRYLRLKLQEEVDEFKKSGFQSMEEMADILEVLRCVAWFNGWDWNAVEQARFDKMASKGKFLDGILLTVNKKDEETESNESD